MALKSTFDVDSEWANFISSTGNDYDEDGSSDIDINEIDQFKENDEETVSADLSFDFNAETPKSSNIYISTKTKIAYLNKPIDLKYVFWKIPIIPYANPRNGVIKKQMKFNSTAQEELNDITERLQLENYYEEHVITNINNPNGRIKFKDIRKVRDTV